MVYTEFVSADALIRSVGKTQQKLNISDEERPVAIQIYGRDTATMVEAARIVEQAHPDTLDINFGCPVKRVAGKGAGAGMLQNIPLMLEITRAVDGEGGNAAVLQLLGKVYDDFTVGIPAQAGLHGDGNLQRHLPRTSDFQHQRNVL